MHLRKSAFTLIELLATVAILAVLTTTALVFIGNYVTWSRETADKQTYVVLSDALTRYKTEGGHLPALTEDAPISHVLARLGGTMSWNGMVHQALRAGSTFSASMLTAVGNGRYYRFTGYGSYQSSEVAGSPAAPTGPSPYPDGVGYLARAGTVAADIVITSSTSKVAYKINGGATAWLTYYGQPVNLPANSSMTFWSCDADGSETKSGSITSILSNSAQISSLNVRSLHGLTSLSLNFQQIASLDVSGITTLTTVNLEQDSALTSFKAIGCTGLTLVNVSSSGALKTLNVSGCTALQDLYCYSCSLSTLNVQGCTALRNLSCDDNDLSTINVDGLTSLRTFYCGNNPISSISLSNLPNLYDFEIYDSNLSSLTISNCPGMLVLYLNNNKLTSLNLSGMPNLRNLWCASNKLTSLNLSGSPLVGLLKCDNNLITSITLSGFGKVVLGMNSPIFSCTNNSLSKDALESIFTQLPPYTVDDHMYIHYGSNPGTATADSTIATGKGWYIYTD